MTSAQTSALIKDLHPGVNYGLAIIAENTVGRGEPSDTVSFTTGEEGSCKYSFKFFLYKIVKIYILKYIFRILASYIKNIYKLLKCILLYFFNYI